MRSRYVQHPCAVCGKPAWGFRCKACYEKSFPGIGRRPGLSNDWGERKRRAFVVRAHRAEFGDVCPGWGRDPHPAEDLCADHVWPVAAGGAEDGPLGVLCRSCNGRKRDRPVDPNVALRPVQGASRAW